MSAYAGDGVGSKASFTSEQARRLEDPVIVKRLTNQVAASTITTRNGAIQREMQEAYRKLIVANVERKLTLQDVASFSTFLVGVRSRLQEKGSSLRRKHTVLSSLLKHAPRARVQRIYSDLSAVEEQESALSKDVDLFNKLQQDLKDSPAYKAMMDYGKSSGMVNIDGTMMPDPAKHPELEAMASMSVKDMLAEFKMEDRRNQQASLASHLSSSVKAATGLGLGSSIGQEGHKHSKDHKEGFSPHSHEKTESKGGSGGGGAGSNSGKSKKKGKGGRKR